MRLLLDAGQPQSGPKGEIVTANLESAIAIAVQAHAGQVDKGGTPYILHPLRVRLTESSPSFMTSAKIAKDGLLLVWKR